MIHLLLPTKKFIPNEFHHEFYDVDFQALYEKGYRLILTDLDNTLISYAEDLPTKKIMDTFSMLEQIGFEIIIISNNHPPRINTFTKDLQVQGIGDARKPLSIGLKNAMKLSKNNYTKSQTVVIGDQLMTDIFGANRLGLYSILVNPIKRKTEKWYTKFNRKIEEKMLRKIKYKESKLYQDLHLDKRV